MTELNLAWLWLQERKSEDESLMNEKRLDCSTQEGGDSM